MKVGRRDFLKGGGAAALWTLLRGKKTLEEFIDKVDEQAEEYVEELPKEVVVTPAEDWNMGRGIHVSGWYTSFVMPICEKNRGIPNIRGCAIVLEYDEEDPYEV